MNERFALMMDVFPKAMFGWAGVFAVILLVMGVMVLLDKVTSRKK